MKKGRHEAGNENGAWLALHEGRNAQPRKLAIKVHSAHPRRVQCPPSAV